MSDFAGNLFSTEGFVPRWDCGNWTSFLGWLHIVSDLGICAAYTAIPFALSFFAMKRRDLPFKWLFVMFSTFIFACGFTHMMDALMFWTPMYRLLGAFKLGTVLISWTTVIALLPVLPKAFALRSPKELEREIVQREQAERELTRLNGRMVERARFARALNQTDSATTFQGALDCIVEATGAAVAVLFARGERGKFEARHATGIDPRARQADQFDPEGLPAVVAEARRVVAVDGPFSSESLKLRVGVGTAEVRAIVGWPILFQDRCVGVLVTAHLAPPDAEHRDLVLANLEQLAIRMNGFEVERQRLQLVGDLQEKSKALEVSNREAERASRVKSEFLANMSHELRTPMNSILGFTQRLIKTLNGDLSERDHDALLTVDRNAKHLLGLINDILDLSKIEAGRMELKRSRFDAVAAVGEVAKQVAPLAEAKGLAVRTRFPEGELVVEADRTKLIQVVTNLVSNAIKYTERGEVTVGLATIDDPVLGESLALEVSDTGVGITEENVKLLFTPFTQIDSGTTRKVGGTGLGLYICSQYVGMHGGRIGVNSRIGEGSTFTVVIPRVPGPGQNGNGIVRHADGRALIGGAPVGPQARRAGVVVLCVDDDPDVLKYLQLTLEHHGYGVILARNGLEGIRLARQERPDLICMDINMPGLSGYDVLAQLREDVETAQVPVIVASIRSEEARRLNVGARCYLAKPFTSEDLVAGVRSVLCPEIRSALIIDDDPDCRKLVGDMLGEHQIPYREAANGRDGIARLREEVPSVILLDLMMPEMDGFEFLRRLRQDPVWKSIPVVVLTAMPLGSDVMVMLGQACDCILAKGRVETLSVVDSLLQAVVPVSKRAGQQSASLEGNVQTVQEADPV